LLWEQTANRILPIQSQIANNSVVGVLDFWEYPNETKIQLFSKPTISAETQTNTTVPLYFNDPKANKKMFIDISTSDTIAQIKQKLQEKDSSYSKNIVFISDGGRKLEDHSKTLFDYNINAGGSTIHLSQQNL